VLCMTSFCKKIDGLTKPAAAGIAASAMAPALAAAVGSVRDQNRQHDRDGIGRGSEQPTSRRADAVRQREYADARTMGRSSASAV
jgi:hypothetical protein